MVLLVAGVAVESGLRNEIIGPFIRGKIRRELYHLYELVLSNKPRRILDEMCRLYGKFASYSSHVLCKTRLIFPRINGPIISLRKPLSSMDKTRQVNRLTK